MAAFALALAVLTAIPARPAAARNLALLMGVAAYDNPAIRSLQGPRNDVILLWRYLTAQGFAAEDIRVLAEGLPEAPNVPRPRAPATRSEIMAGLADLAERAGSDDFIVIHYSGHGTTEPELDPEHNPEPEPGGRDQVLLPKDAGKYDAASRRIVNGVIDDEIGEALDKIRAKGATIWVIVDACHAGTVTRSGATVTRAVEPEALGVPQAVPPARPAQAPDRGGLVKGLARKGAMIGFFAVDAWTEALERPFPSADASLVGEPGKQRFGVFTWHLLRALNSGRAQTFRDLARLASLDMAASTNLAQAPLPVFDGDLDRPLFGKQAGGPSRFTVKRDADAITLDAGSLNGFDVGAEIGVFDGPLADARRVSTARIVSADAGSSRAEIVAQALPTAPALWASLDKPAVALRFRVAIDGEVQSQASTRQWLTQAVQQSNAEGVAVDLIEGGNGDITLRSHQGRLWLVPEGQSLVTDTGSYERSYAIPLDGRNDADIIADLRTALWTFARAANLVRIASSAELSGASAEAVDIQLSSIRETDAAMLAQPKRACGTLQKPSQAASLGSGSAAAVGHCDQIRLSISNRGERDLDIGVFFLDPSGAISIPVRDWRQNGCVGFLPAKSERPLVLRSTVRTWTDKGPEHTGQHRILIFALPRSERLPPNLCHLLQPSAEAARAEAVATRGAGTRKGFTALLERAALVDSKLRAANPFEDDPAEGGNIVVRQFTLDIRPPPLTR